MLASVGFIQDFCLGGEADGPGKGGLSSKLAC